jgi:L-fuculose-phosphate aldolase
VYTDFIKYGRVLWEAGLIHLTAGNISIRKDSKIIITHAGALLGFLSKKELVTVHLKNSTKDRGASSEVAVHRAIYLAHPQVRAVVHAHPPYATVLSLGSSRIKTVDSDSLFIPEIPVLTECSYGEGSRCVAKVLPKLFRNHNIVLIRGHGVFAIGKTIQEAASNISMMENQCRIIFLRKLLI